MRVAMPVASHVDERSPFNRATVSTGQSTGPVARAVTASRMRWTISGGTVNVSGWVARSTHMQRARKACTASDVQVHLVGCTSQPKWRRIAMMRCTAPRASRAKRAPKTTQSRYCRMSRLPRPFTGKVGPLPTKWMGGEPDAGRPQEARARSKTARGALVAPMARWDPSWAREPIPWDLDNARERRKDLNKSSAWRVRVHAHAHTAAVRYYKYKKYPSYNVINGPFKVLS
jgi:hypothetical protein